MKIIKIFHFSLLNVPKFLQYVTNNKDADNEWFRVESTKDGTRSVKRYYLGIAGTKYNYIIVVIII